MEDVSIGVVVLIMVGAIFASFIPFIPGPALVWFFGCLYALLSGFERISVLALVLMTLFMIIGATVDFWLRALGMQTRDTSCWASLGSGIGGMLGTVLIPIPLLGTIIGLVVGAILVEFMRLGELRPAMSEGKYAFKLYVIGEAIELSMSLAIIAVFITSAWLTA